MIKNQTYISIMTLLVGFAAALVMFVRTLLVGAKKVATQIHKSVLVLAILTLFFTFMAGMLADRASMSYVPSAEARLFKLSLTMTVCAWFALAAFLRQVRLSKHVTKTN